ncbi:uncharacterized protein BDV14DRAFT_70539 [Aspergillus stella-maris]|uniref:uncharacterized protein n=1 Tax=Aspergillus stella-maris TaxID=1810926 RepID=UPI003CCD388D
MVTIADGRFRSRGIWRRGERRARRAQRTRLERDWRLERKEVEVTQRRRGETWLRRQCSSQSTHLLSLSPALTLYLHTTA